MRKSFLIARSNIRKSKGQTAAILVLILIAALMLNLWLMLSMDYKANFDRYHDKLNAEHVTLSVADDTAEGHEFLTQTLENDDRTAQYSLDSHLLRNGSFEYNDGTMEFMLVFMDKQTATSRNIGKVEIVEDSNLTSGIYLPMIYKSNKIAVGKTIDISLGSNIVKYTVCGFFNSIMLGSHNCSLTQVILTADKYAELAETGLVKHATLCSIRLKDKAKNQDFESDLKSAVSAHFPNTFTIISNNYDIVSQGRYISQMITSTIIAVMAFIVLLIALVVIVSNIINYIQVNMKNLGALKALGYTSRQLVCSLLLQFLGVTLIASIVGIGLSYCLFPAINSMMISQTGIPYAMRFLPLPLLISIAILSGTVALFVWLAARKVKKIEPIAALRSGVTTHNFKKNHVPLDKTKAPLNLALALKTTLSGIKHNITVCITMLVLSFVVVFSGVMTENVIVDMTPFLDLIVGEYADSSITVQADAEDEFLRAINADSRVEKAYLYTSFNVSHVGGVDLMATICDDYSKLNNKSVVYTGRFPKYDNEIALGGKYAQEKGFKVGDEIEITANGKSEKYLICGLTQVSNYLGKDCILTRDGYGRLGTITDPAYYINLTSGTDIDAFNAEVMQKFPGKIYTTVNIDKTIDGAASVYVSLMTIIVIAILFLSAVIIAFVLYLLVRTMLNNKMRDYGVLKALGYTTRQLILQTALSFMPAVIISTVIGLIVSSFVMNPLLSLFLSSLGIVKCTFAVPVVFIVGAGFGLILFAFGFACLLSLKIRKIAPKTLLVGE